MALLSDYTAGTVSVAANGTTVTGSGTAWKTAQFKEGDWFIANGFVSIVASVESNTSLTLVSAWKGGALSGADYRLRYMSDGSRASAQARSLIDLLGGSGNLEALAGLAGSADKLPIFTGAGTMGLADLTAFARTLLDDADAASVLTTLGIPYEVGSFIPQIGFSTPGTFAPTYAVQDGTYVKIGELVVISINLQFDANAYTGAGGVLRVTSLPFVATGGTGYAFAFSRIGRVIYSGSNVVAEIPNSQSYATLWTIQSGLPPAFLSTPAIPPSTTGMMLIGSGAYRGL